MSAHVKNDYAQGYDAGYMAGIGKALSLIQRAEPAPQTRASEEGFAASKGRMVRILRNAIEDAKTVFSS